MRACSILQNNRSRSAWILHFQLQVGLYETAAFVAELEGADAVVVADVTTPSVAEEDDDEVAVGVAVDVVVLKRFGMDGSPSCQT